MNILKKLVHPHKLLAIAKVVEHRNVTHAAKELNMTQPAVTNIIRQLEQHFEQPLIKAEGKNLMITEAASHLADYWNKVIRIYEDMHNTMEATEQGDIGKIRINMVSTAKYFMPNIINQFIKEHPKAEITCHITHREKILPNLKKHIADIVIITNPEKDTQLDYVKLRQNKLGFICHPKHQLANKKAISLHELAQQHFITREKRALITQALFNYFIKYKKQPFIKYEIDSTEAIKEALISNHDHLALLPLDSVQRALDNKLLIKLDITKDLNSTQEDQHWHIVTHNEFPLNSISKKFLTFIHEKLSSSC